MMSYNFWRMQKSFKTLHMRSFSRGLHRKKKAFVSSETVPQFFGKLQVAMEVSSLLRETGWDARAHDTLLALHVPWDTFTVVQVLKHPMEPDVAWSFFNWLKARSGYKHDPYTYNSIIEVFGRSGKAENIQDVLKDMSQEGCPMNTVTLTTVMYWYGKSGMVDLAMDIWNQMRVIGLKPNVVSYTSVIHLLLKEKMYNQAMRLYMDMVESGCRPNSRTYTVLIEALANAGKLDAALLVFNNMQMLKASPTSITYSVLMSSFAKLGNVDMVMKLYKQMKISGMHPNEKAYVALIDLLHRVGKQEEVDILVKDMNFFSVQGESGDILPSESFATRDIIEDVKGVYGEANRPMPSSDTSSNSESWVSLVDMRALSAILLNWCPANFKALDELNIKWNPPKALRVLLGLKNPDVAWNFFNWVKQHEGYKHDHFTYSKMISILIRNKRFRFVDLLLEEIQKDSCHINVVTFNMIIFFLIKASRPDDALKMFFWMKELKVQPDVKTFTLLVEMFTKTKQNEKALEMYKQMLEAGCKPDTHTYTSLIHTLGIEGKTNSAYAIFEKMADFGCEPTVVTYTALIDALFRKGEHEKAMILFSDMQEKGIKPTSVTFAIVAKALKSTGQIEEAEKIKQNIVSVRGQKMLSHSATVVYSTVLRSFSEIERVPATAIC
ncbi:hypothetical protein O6H91_14G059200 [Diphasiastrum complanatum]|uniref:Uncharacterized protein n=4 Tax=Diphasiastrum complanatum TaxID=34168 RepID=A0ACC2BPW7_DIPCM|nr:hypothetical protein O6H91_Y462300 [Diphasiastrum complanatum]KAJ7227616.1 hypothetical protein O6H91_Y462300 [Diphasiastrum complanatum]KAJ7227617.1 hypothetical protein O6H91_Y462300 [Diphasiastrum complanatum]KAJ7531802.1 hypothetical protein O6H91_14G059200 [Diphasiastrum complanatum]KAJ7531803.1 hypothetical protein O6H91_14G059200 [Diphasiastrum complanatum]